MSNSGNCACVKRFFETDSNPRTAYYYWCGQHCIKNGKAPDALTSWYKELEIWKGNKEHDCEEYLPLFCVPISPISIRQQQTPSVRPQIPLARKQIRMADSREPGSTPSTITIESSSNSASPLNNVTATESPDYFSFSPQRVAKFLDAKEADDKNNIITIKNSGLPGQINVKQGHLYRRKGYMTRDRILASGLYKVDEIHRDNNGKIRIKVRIYTKDGKVSNIDEFVEHFDYWYFDNAYEKIQEWVHMDPKRRDKHRGGGLWDLITAGVDDPIDRDWLMQHINDI